MNILKELKDKKNSMIIGAATGAAIVILEKIRGVDLTFAMQSRAGLDIALPSVDVVTMAFIKSLFLMALFGAFIGYVIESLKGGK